jgi:hypothetical protein
VKSYLRCLQAVILYQFSSSSLFYMAGLGLLFLVGLSGNTRMASAQAGLAFEARIAEDHIPQHLARVVERLTA